MRVVLMALLLAGSAIAGEEVVKNGTFADGATGWSELASDDKREAAVIKEDGKPLLVLKRKAAGAEPAVQAVQYNLKFKPQTLYRISVSGKGDTAAQFSFKPQSSKDPAYDKVSKSWATSSCPLPASKDFETQTLIFDSGLKPDSAFVNIRLNGEAPGSYAVQKVSLEEIGTAKPRSDETIILHIGDSLSATSYLPFNDRQQLLLDERFKKELPGKAVRNVNVAADGEFCKEFLETGRYAKVVKENLAKVDIAVIRYGSNDQGVAKQTPEEFKTHLTALCDALQKDFPGVKIVLGTGTWLPKNDEINKKYRRFWQVSRDLAKERNYPLADICAKFEADGTYKPLRAEGDMHPNAFGVQLAAGVVFDAVKKLVEGK